MILVELYENIFEVDPQSPAGQEFLAKCQNSRMVSYLRRIYRTLNLSEREIAFFGNNTAQLEEIDFNLSGDDDEARKMEETYKDKGAKFQQFFYTFLFARIQLNGRIPKYIAVLVYDNLGPNEDNKQVLSVLNSYFKCLSNELFNNIDFELFNSLHAEYPIDKQGWANLIFKYADTEASLLYWFAPLIQNYLGSVPKDDKELQDAFNKLHEKEWSLSALYLLAVYSICLKQEGNFIEKLNSLNFNKIARDDETLRKLSLYLRNKVELQKQFINRVDNTFLNYHEGKFDEIRRILENFVIELRLPFIEKIGIAEFLQNLEKSHDKPFFKLRYAAEQLFSKDEELRYNFFKQIKCWGLYITTYFDVKTVLELIKPEYRFDFCMKNIGKEALSKLSWNAYQLALVLNLIPQNQRLSWIKEVFKPHEILNLKYGESGNEWGKLRSALTTADRQNLNIYMYPEQGMEVHNQVKSIKRHIKNISWLDHRAAVNIETPCDPGFISTNIGSQELFVPEPVMAQIEVLWAIRAGKKTEETALQEIKALGKQAQEEISHGKNPNSMFYSGSAKEYLKSFENDEALKQYIKV